MTDPKKPRQPRQITLGLAIDRLLAIRAAGETAATKAATRARARYVARWDALMASVPEHLLPAVRSALAASAGSIEEQEADRWSEEGADAFEESDDAVATEIAAALASPVAGQELVDAAPAIPEADATVPAAELPRGALPYTPGAAAKAARGAR